jgi:hypothetical protein
VTQTAKDALTWESDRPSTPEHLKPFQHYARQPAGTITRHFGSAHDDVPKDKVFGCKTKASKESAAECMSSYPDSEIGRWKLVQSETVYARWVHALTAAGPTESHFLAADQACCQLAKLLCSKSAH